MNNKMISKLMNVIDANAEKYHRGEVEFYPAWEDVMQAIWYDPEIEDRDKAIDWAREQFYIACDDANRDYYL